MNDQNIARRTELKGVVLSRRFDDLTWYFTAAESSLGLSSNYSAILAMGFRGPSASADYEPINDHLIDAASRYRKTRTRLARCSSATRRVLEAAYSHSLVHPQLGHRDALGDLVPLALLDHTEKVLLGLVARNEKAKLGEIRSRCRTALRAAEDEFATMLASPRMETRV